MEIIEVPSYYKKYDQTLIKIAISAQMHPEQVRLNVRDLRRALNKKDIQLQMCQKNRLKKNLKTK